jgi:hypothetical protein
MLQKGHVYTTYMVKVSLPLSIDLNLWYLIYLVYFSSVFSLSIKCMFHIDSDVNLSDQQKQNME